MSRRAALGLGLRLRLTLRIQLLAQCVEGILQLFREFLDFVHIFALCGLLQLIDFGFNGAFFSGGDLVTEISQ